MRVLQHLLTDDLGGEETLGLIGEVLGRIQRLAFRQVLQQQTLERVHVRTVDGGQRDELDE